MNWMLTREARKSRDAVPCAKSGDDGNRCPTMRCGEFLVQFDSLYGGAPSLWFLNGKQITDDFAGAGYNIIYATGQDPTQGSANGPDPFPIARLLPGDASSIYSYYARELAFGGGEYHVSGHAPFFWASQDAGDDSIPAPPGMNHAWITWYP